MAKTAELAAEPTTQTKPGEDLTKGDVDAAKEVGPTDKKAPVLDDGGQTPIGPTTEEAAAGEDGSKRSKAAKKAAAVAEAEAELKADEEPTFKEVMVVSLNDYGMNQQVDHANATRSIYFIRPSEDPQRAFDDQWLRNNVKAGLLKIEQ